MDKTQTIVCILVLVVVFVAVALLVLNTSKISRTYAKSSEPFLNPFIGYAPMAQNIGDDIDVTLAYVEVRWSMWEPEEGKFDYDALEEKYELSRLRENGVHLVLRFVCDMPEDEAHRDIPQWLYDKTGDGMDYHTTYGYGYTPDYNNKTFIEAHAKAIAALGEYLGQDTFVSYVQFGSLGHWGEWHVKYDAGLTRLPKESVREQYVTPYLTAFPNAEMMMRRPFTHAEKHGFGLFNDMVGDVSETQRWLSWIEEGGEYAQTDETDAIVPMHDCWETSPIGGEFTSGTDMKTLLVTEFDRTLSMIKKSHMTFIGPKTADEEYEEARSTVLLNLGYRLRIKKAEVSASFGKCFVKLEWTNDGVAPMYQDLPVYLVLLDKDGNDIAMKQVEITLSDLLPGETVNTKTEFVTEGFQRKLKSGEYKLALEIVDPMTGEACVRLAQDSTYEDGKNILFEK